MSAAIHTLPRRTLPKVQVDFATQKMLEIYGAAQLLVAQTDTVNRLNSGCFSARELAHARKLEAAKDELLEQLYQVALQIHQVNSQQLKLADAVFHIKRN